METGRRGQFRGNGQCENLEQSPSASFNERPALTRFLAPGREVVFAEGFGGPADPKPQNLGWTL